MYRPVAPAVGMFPRQRMFSFLIPIVFGTSLFVIAAVIVLALLPIYLETKTVTLNPNTVTSKLITMSIEVQANNTGSKSRNRRASGDLSNYTSGVFTSTANEMFASQIQSQLSSPKIQNVDVVSASLVYSSSKRRKRLTISKRATNQRIALLLNFYIRFISGCLSTCQAATGPAIRTALYALPPSVFSFTNLPITVNGVVTTLPRLEFVSILFVSAILSGTSSVTQTVPVLIANLTTIATTTVVTTSTAATTPMIVG